MFAALHQLMQQAGDGIYQPRCVKSERQKELNALSP
jgi:hypothetical protein